MFDACSPESKSDQAHFSMREYSRAAHVLQGSSWPLNLECCIGNGAGRGEVRDIMLKNRRRFPRGQGNAIRTVGSFLQAPGTVMLPRAGAACKIPRSYALYLAGEKRREEDAAEALIQSKLRAPFGNAFNAAASHVLNRSRTLRSPAVSATPS